MIFIATIILISLTIGSGYWYLKLVPENSSFAWKIRSVLRGAATFFVIFFIFNGLIDEYMPRFFYRFIMTFGDPAGVLIIIILAGALNILAAKYFFTKTFDEKISK